MIKEKKIGGYLFFLIVTVFVIVVKTKPHSIPPFQGVGSGSGH